MQRRRRVAQRAGHPDIVADLRAELARSPATVEATTARGLELIRKAKAEGERETLVAQLMNRYRLSTEEGVVLMVLAEALLRIPDQATADALALAREIAARPPKAMRAAKRLLDLAAHGDAKDILLAESREQAALIGAAEQVEAVSARLQKRPAVFVD